MEKWAPTSVEEILGPHGYDLVIAYDVPGLVKGAWVNKKTGHVITCAQLTRYRGDILKLVLKEK